jgi:hypothetical protein
VSLKPSVKQHLEAGAPAAMDFTAKQSIKLLSYVGNGGHRYVSHNGFTNFLVIFIFKTVT